MNPGDPLISHSTDPFIRFSPTFLALATPSRKASPLSVKISDIFPEKSMTSTQAGTSQNSNDLSAKIVDNLSDTSSGEETELVDSEYKAPVSKRRVTRGSRGRRTQDPDYDQKRTIAQERNRESDKKHRIKRKISQTTAFNEAREWDLFCDMINHKVGDWTNNNPTHPFYNFVIPSKHQRVALGDKDCLDKSEIRRKMTQFVDSAFDTIDKLVRENKYLRGKEK